MRNVKLIVVLSLLSFCFAARTRAVVLNDKPDDSAWGTDGEVKAMVRDTDGNFYVGGVFNEITDSAGRTGGFLIADKDSGSVLLSSIKTNSTVFATVEDGTGGLFIGGMFTSINGQKRNCLAHIMADGTLDPSFAPNITGGQGSVRNIILSDGYLYVSGNFTIVNGLTRNYMVKMDMEGNVDPSFTPNFNNPVFQIRLLNSNLYVVGSFTTINGSAIKYMAKLDLSGTPDLTFTPNINGAINYESLVGNDFYIGGVFTTAGSVGTTTTATHKGIAKISSAGIVDHTFNPNFTGTFSNTTLANQVYWLAATGTSIYVAGNFTTVSSSATTTTVTRNGIAKLDQTGKVDAAFAPNFDGIVWSMLPYGNSFYVSGEFNNLNSSPINHLIKMDYSGNIDSSFNLPVNHEAWVFGSSSGTSLYVGGKFNSYVPGIARNYIAKFSPAGVLDASFNPIFSGGAITSMAISGSNIYIGGNFTAAGSAGTTTTMTHNYMAKMNTSGLIDHTFSPSFDDYISSLTILGTDIYAAGAFKNVSSTGTTTLLSRRLAKLNPSGVVDASFNPIFNSSIMTIAATGTDIYVGGTFTTVASAGTTTAITHGRLAKLNTSGIIDHTFSPSFNNTIRTIDFYGSNIYVGGLFTAATSTGASSGLTRTSLAKLNTAGIIDPDFAPSFPLSVFSLIANNGEIYATGNFLLVNSLERNYIAKFDTSGNLDPLFQPVMGGYGSTVFMFDNNLYVGNSHTPSPFRFSPDTLAPVVTLNGASSISLNRSQSYTDAGATALDANFGDLSSSISVDNPVDTNIAGIYTIRYSVPDSAGNIGTATRTVTINANEILPAGADYSPEQIIALERAGNNPSGSTSGATQFSINDNIPFTTDNPLVTLRFNNFNSPSISRLAISASSDFTGASLINYAPTSDYNICSGAPSCPDGDYTVYAKYYSTWGQASQPASLKITLKRNAAPILAVEPASVETASSNPTATSTSISATTVSPGLSIRLSGRILIQTESHGEAWYINPSDHLRYYLGRPADAYNLMRKLGLGATNKDIKLFRSSATPHRLAGKILLQVQDKGQAYYVNPLDLKLYYLGRPADAFALMRSLGLGITNGDLGTISTGKTE